MLFKKQNIYNQEKTRLKYFAQPILSSKLIQVDY